MGYTLTTWVNIRFMPKRISASCMTKAPTGFQSALSEREITQI
jgi:hypothetical protein